MDSFFYMVIAAGAIAGASTGLLGVYIVGMRMPFIGTCVSHAAMAGTVGALVFGVNPWIGALGAAMVTSLGMAAIRVEKSRTDTNVGLAIIFSLMLGLTFLGMGLVEGSRSEVLGLLWGSILFVQDKTVWMISISAGLLLAFVMLFNKEMKVILFSRSIAEATGVHGTFVYCLFLGLCGLTIAVNLKMIGGLMLFSLITNPAAAAYQICTGHRAVMVVSVLFGVASAVLGFLVSFYLNLPTGACIVITSTLIFAGSIVYKKVTGCQ